MILGIFLLALGLALIVAEVLIPSMGVLSILATASIGAAIIVAFREDSTTGVQFLVATAVLVPAVMVLGFKLFPKSPVGQKMVMSGLSFDSAAATDERDLALVDRVGTVEADLRPTGIARFDGRRVDVVSRGELIEAGAVVRVIDVSGNRVVVAAAESGDASVQEPSP